MVGSQVLSLRQAQRLTGLFCAQGLAGFQTQELARYQVLSRSRAGRVSLALSQGQGALSLTLLTLRPGKLIAVSKYCWKEDKGRIYLDSGLREDASIVAGRHWWQKCQRGHNQECLAGFPFSLLILSGTPEYGMVPPMLVFLHVNPHRHTQKCVSWVISNQVWVSVKRNHHTNKDILTSL